MQLFVTDTTLEKEKKEEEKNEEEEKEKEKRLRGYYNFISVIMYTYAPLEIN